MTATKNRGCAGKQRHATEAGARAQLFNLEHDRAAVRLVVYRCKFCGGWHVDHRMRRRR